MRMFILEEIKNLNPNLKELRKFGLTVGIVLSLLFLFLFYKQKIEAVWVFSFPAILIIFGIALPKALNRVYLIWMAFAITIQWIMTHLILTIVFYTVITLIGLLHRIFRKDVLSLRFKTNTKSYWKKREVKDVDLKSYERQF